MVNCRKAQGDKEKLDKDKVTGHRPGPGSVAGQKPDFKLKN